MKLSFEDALNFYLKANLDAYGHLDGVSAPKELMSDVDSQGRWILRNINGFLAYVTATGQVLNHRFQKIRGTE